MDEIWGKGVWKEHLYCRNSLRYMLRLSKTPASKLAYCSFIFILRQSFSVEPWLTWNLQGRLGCPPTRRNSPASAYQVLGLKLCATTARSTYFHYEGYYNWFAIWGAVLYGMKQMNA